MTESKITRRSFLAATATTATAVAVAPLILKAQTLEQIKEMNEKLQS